MYYVLRLHGPTSEHPEPIEARDHRNAAELSRFNVPSTDLLVSNGPTTIRYHVDTLGRITEQSRYSA